MSLISTGRIGPYQAGYRRVLRDAALITGALLDQAVSALAVLVNAAADALEQATRLGETGLCERLTLLHDGAVTEFERLRCTALTARCGAGRPRRTSTQKTAPTVSVARHCTGGWAGTS